jgi:uncharacterized protein (DUF433 family)
MIDWRDCDLVQTDPRFVSGQPALRSSPRTLVEPLVESALTYGEEPAEISEQFGIPEATIRDLLTYAKAHSVPSPA